MSGLDCAYDELFETCQIKNAIMVKHRKIKEYIITIYCLEKDINVDKEKKCF